ncbi:MAG: tetratricopeptide repeat protein [Planctomycetota bacterium]
MVTECISQPLSNTCSPVGGEVSLPVIGTAGRVVRKSRTSRWRTLSLVLVQLAIVAHVVHWLGAGKTLSPVEPSEAMYTLNEGKLNAGFIFFAAALLSTLIFGRFFCGWGCHLIAYQDLAAWMLKKIGIRPRAFRSRLPLLAPLALALYMYVWPSAYRLATGSPFPEMSNQLVTTEFWDTFPGVVVGAITFVVCGFLIVYVLGSKGFCTYACPYGGFFGLLDPLSPGRIRVTDACSHCGHCTAACSSNVRVHEEVALFKQVVDPGCMKCMDCISVCPNDALYFGFGPPALGARSSAPARRAEGVASRASLGRGPARDFSLAQEALMIAVGLAALTAFRGLYGQIPLLLAMGMAAITGFAVLKLTRMFRSANVRFQNLQLVRGGRWTRSGMGFAGLAALLILFTGHSLLIQSQVGAGRKAFASLSLSDRVWFPGNAWWEQASDETKATVGEATRWYERAESWGVTSTPAALQDLVWLYLAAGDTVAAERAVRRMIELAPNHADAYRGLAGIRRKLGDPVGAEENYRKALSLRPTFAPARVDLGAMLRSQGRTGDATALYRAGTEVSPDDTRWPIETAGALLEAGRFAEALDELDAALRRMSGSSSLHAMAGVIEIRRGRADEALARFRQAVHADPKNVDARLQLALTLLGFADRSVGRAVGDGASPDVAEAIGHLEAATNLRPRMAAAYYNLGVAKFMAGRLAEAVPHVREAIRLSPEDPQPHEFLAMVLGQLGDRAGAEMEAAEAKRVQSPNVGGAP